MVKHENCSAQKSVEAETVAQAFIELLVDRGIDHLFGNGGTDFAPILDALAWAKAQGRRGLVPVTVPHEMVAASIAHGYYLVTGKPQVVMTHVTVGTANATAGIINAARDNIPIIFTAGRTPLTEAGRPGSRDTHIHWAQESFDQSAMVREYVKWDYELRNEEQLETVVDRAIALAMTPPRGPVYLTLPREVLAQKLSKPFFYSSPMRQSPVMANRPDPSCIDDAASLLAAAEAPLIITTCAGRSEEAFNGLIRLAELCGAPVVVSKSRYLNFPTEHPLHLGFDPHPFFQADEDLYEAGADVVLVIDSDVPWYPSRGRPKEKAHVIQMAQDPFYCRYPIRGFPCDVPLAGEPAQSLGLLVEAVKNKVDPRKVEARKCHLRTIHDAQRARWKATVADAAKAEEITMEWATHCIDQVKDNDTIVINEYDMVAEQMHFKKPGTNFEQSSAGGLGWALGAALGVKLGAQSRTVISIVGDGNYMFCVPTSAHFVGSAYNLPTLTVIFNNQCWNAVRKANLGMYKGGWAERTCYFPLSELSPSPRFELIAQACGAYGRAVSDPNLLEDELRKALEVVRIEGRQAVINVICRLEPQVTCT
ncbi:MAG: thiamine pyrophosphate-requiring protein [Methylocystis sp.]|uniref:thiamine pyrophosphate-requiring protein n=1 Tax=Methylocystis sp. TaxID=1911079 RepID=UPI003DA42087